MIRPAQVLSLVVAGVALAGAGAWLLSRHGADSAPEAQGQVLPLKPGDLNAVTRLRIFRGDGSHTTLTRTATRWVVTERDYPADTGQARKLLLDLAALQIEELKTTDARLYAKLGVEDPVSAQATSTGLEIDVNGKTLGLIVGKSSGTRAGFVRVAGAVQSLLATPQLSPDADPRHWLDRSILDIAPEQITEVSLEPQVGPAYAVKRAVAGATSEFRVSPIPKGRELADAAASASQAGALAGLQLDDVRKAAAHTGVARARFQTSDGLEVAINGIQDGERRYLTIIASGTAPAVQQRVRDLNARLSGWEFEVPGYRYDTLFRPLEQLLKPLAAAPAAGSAKPPHSPAKVKAGQDRVTPQQSH
jgi:hypothetical protein